MFEDAKQMIAELVPKQDYRQNAKFVLNEAINQNFETVIVLGFKDGNISVKSSKWERTISIIGALEYAKHHILENQVDA